MKHRIVVSSFVLTVAACAGGETKKTELPPPTAIVVDQALQAFPRFIEVQDKVIARSCSPNPGVCHQSNNYPDLSTPGNVIGSIGLPCNLELPDPTKGWDRCEPKPDRLVADGLTADIAWIERVGRARFRAHLDTAATVTASVGFSIRTPAGQIVVANFDEEAFFVAGTTAGSKDVILTVAEMEDEGLAEALESTMTAVLGGDPNRNGIFGGRGDTHTTGALLVPGDLEASYLWGRITGTVPGSRMPLANQALSNAEYIAIACWIEGLPTSGTPDAAAPIDYDNCKFANAPTSYESSN